MGMGIGLGMRIELEMGMGMGMSAGTGAGVGAELDLLVLRGVVTTKEDKEKGIIKRIITSKGRLNLAQQHSSRE